MALTPALQFGQLEMDYVAYGVQHVFRVWVDEFNRDAGVGTFVNPTAPLSLDALATELHSVLIPLFNSGAGLSVGAWRGTKVTTPATGATIPWVEGTTTPGSGTPNSSPNVPGLVSQASWAFRDSMGKLVKNVLIGAVYAGPLPFLYSGISGGYKAYTDYILGSPHITGRAGVSIVSLIDITFDTNDGLTRKARR